MKRSVTKQSEPNNTIPLMVGEQIHVGIDVHKKHYNVNLWSEVRRQSLVSWTQPPCADLLIRRLAPYRQQVSRIVYEAGPTGYSLVRALRENNLPAEVIAPSRTPQTTTKQSKTDRIDARRLAMFSAKGLLQPIAVPAKQHEADRQVFRTRQTMVKKRRRVKQQIKSFLLQHGIEQPEGLAHWSIASVMALRQIELDPSLRLSLDVLLDDLAHFQSQIKTTNLALKQVAEQQAHRDMIAVLRTAPGVGINTAMAMRVELVAPERFDDERQVSAIQGLAPLIHQSGQTRHGGPLMKGGNRQLRTILIEAAWRWVRQDPWAADKFARLVVNTGNRKKAIAAMARRLGIILWRMMLTGEPYQPKPVPQDDAPNNGEDRKSPARETKRCQRTLPGKAGAPRKRTPSAKPRRPLPV